MNSNTFYKFSFKELTKLYCDYISGCEHCRDYCLVGRGKNPWVTNDLLTTRKDTHQNIKPKLLLRNLFFIFSYSPALLPLPLHFLSPISLSFSLLLSLPTPLFSFSLSLSYSFLLSFHSPIILPSQVYLLKKAVTTHFFT